MVELLAVAAALNFLIAFFCLYALLRVQAKTERARERERNAWSTERAELVQHVMTLKGYRNTELRSFRQYPPPEQEPDEEENDDPWESL